MATRYKDMTGETEWWTPHMVIALVREIYGGVIDLDPASTAEANEVVQATRFYDKAWNGLRQPWDGRVFVNPPYARGVIDEWAQAAVDEYLRGDGKTHVIWLSNNCTETVWCQKILRYAQAICFPSKRMSFRNRGSDVKTKAMQGQMLAMLSMNPGLLAAFRDVLKWSLGPVFERKL